jgi:hypothetical protein
MIALVDAAAKYADRSILEPSNREIYLARIDAAADRDDEAVRRLASAIGAGWVGSFGFGVRIDQDPDWAHVLGRDDMKALLTELNSRLDRQRMAIERQLVERGVGEKF